MFFSFLTKDTRWFPFPTRESLRWTGPEANFLRWALRDADAQGAEGLLSTWLVISFFDFSIRSQKTVVYSCMKIFLYNIYIMYTLSWNILEIKWHELTLEGSHGEWQRLLDANGDGIIDANNPSEFSFYHHGKAKSIFCVDGGWWSPEIEYLEMNAIHIQKYLENAGKTVPIYIYICTYVYIYISNMGFVGCKRHESWGYG